MELEAKGYSFIVNGEIQETKNIKIFKKIEKPPVYEVIRVINGVPLFFEEHLNRMKESAGIINSDLSREEDEIKNDIIKLIHKNNIVNENIKLISTEIYGIGNTFIVYQISSFYPPMGYYTSGIHTILIDHERKNPNAKIIRLSFKEIVSNELEKNDAFEAMLVNTSGEILEGSRSNIFFVKEDKVYTAKGSEVLLGITRLHILNICKKLNIEIVEENINVDGLDQIEGAFMTGTSVNVLPISSIGKNKINSVDNRIIIEINNQYLAEMENYTLVNKEKWD